ncbi:MAG: 4Fe-4S dicluster domain-containing protein [Acidilobaceae archaeon]
MRLAYLWDSTKCIACMACVVSCAGSNYSEIMRFEEPNPMRKWLGGNIRVVIREVGRPELRLVSCFHCDKPPCVLVCPTRASHIDRDTGLVLLDETKCIGCKACIVACPYGARWLHPTTLLPEKCPGPVCIDIIRGGRKPICVSVCPANARDFGDIDDPNSGISIKISKSKSERPLESLGTEPKYFIVKG